MEYEKSISRTEPHPITKSFRISEKVSNWMWGYFFIAPTLIGLLILNIYPLFQTIYLSLCKSQGFGDVTFIGLDNYINLAHDPEFWSAISNTLKFSLFFIPASIFLSLIIAALLNGKTRFVGLYRVIYFLPMVVAPTAIATVWRWLFNTEQGIVNYLLSLGGISKIGWLTDARFTILSIAIVSVWSIIGYNLILFSAGLKDISRSYYEAADLDGANSIQKFFHITLPLISPTLFFVMITTIMTAIQQFDFLYVLIPRTSIVIDKTQTILYLFYKYAFVIREKGYASAIVLVTVLIILAITWIQIRLEKKWVHYE